MGNKTVVLSMLLAVSLLFNVVAFVRLSDNEPPKAPVPAPEARTSTPAPPVVEVSPSTAAAPASLPAKDVVPATAPAKSKPPAAPNPTLTTAQNDPKVREVLQAGEQFGAFWRDLDKLFKAKTRLEEAKYSGAVTAATADFLELSDPSRAQFEEAAKSAAAAYAQARKEYDAAKQALPPKDKSNAAAYAAYQQQKDVIDARFQTQVKAAVDSLKPYLSTDNAKHQEFTMNAEKWLRNLAPKPSQP